VTDSSPPQSDGAVAGQPLGPLTADAGAPDDPLAQAVSAAAGRGSSRLIAILRRSVTFAITFLGLLLATFVIGRVIPIDPVLAVVGDHASPETYAAAHAAMGLGKPLHHQFWIYLSGLAAGDLGTSVATARPVIEDIARYFPATLELATVAILIGIGFGIPAGVWAAVRRGRLADHVIRVISLLGYSAPTFWLGMIGLLVFYATLGLVAGPGRIDIMFEGLVPATTGVMLIDSLLAREWEVFADALAHLVLPASVLGLFSMAYIARMTRSFMIEQLGQEYVLAARAKGISPGRVVWRHALGNAAVPLITVIALTYGSLLEGSVLTETVFAWPGLGRYLTTSLLNADMNAVLGATIVVGAVFMALNLLSDILYTAIDPRTR
jgi:peptide/nickel transport system permease protein